jgi:hypothetical protein
LSRFHFDVNAIPLVVYKVLESSSQRQTPIYGMLTMVIVTSRLMY